MPRLPFSGSEIPHQRYQYFDAAFGQRIVHTGPETANRAVAFQADNAVDFAHFLKVVFQGRVLVFHDEASIHQRSVFYRGSAFEKRVLIHFGVKQSRTRLCPRRLGSARLAAGRMHAGRNPRNTNALSKDWKAHVYRYRRS